MRKKAPFSRAFILQTLLKDHDDRDTCKEKKKFMKRKKVQEVKDVEVYNPKTGKSKMISLPGDSIPKKSKRKIGR